MAPSSVDADLPGVAHLDVVDMLAVLVEVNWMPSSRRVAGCSCDRRVLVSPPAESSSFEVKTIGLRGRPLGLQTPLHDR